MRVAARLFLSPAGLAYSGEYGRQAPHVLVITA